jgi:predicted DCC family thiol-disulfide oxidoreductase YuxK
MQAGGRKLRIYHDGRCPFCQWSQQTIERQDRDQRLEFRDYHVDHAETPFSLADLSHAMHVQTSDGRWHIGYFGWIEILRALPRRRWLARVMSLPPLRWLGPLVYRLVAANRYRIPRFLLRWLGAPPVCNAACDLAKSR